jgi:hypothetical protein
MKSSGDGTSSTPGGSTSGTPAGISTTPPLNVRVGDDHGEGWPVCRCGHPMHPSGIEKRRGIPLERFECPKHRWWNVFWHPVVWQDPRE